MAPPGALARVLGEGVAAHRPRDLRAVVGHRAAVAAVARVAAVPVALLPTNVLFTTVTFSSCVPMAPPFEPLLPVKVLPSTMSVPTPWPLMAPPETSCPVEAHWLFVNVQSMTVSEPPSSKMAAPPSVVDVVFEHVGRVAVGERRGSAR